MKTLKQKTMKTLQITEYNALRLYETASPEFKITLEDTFGKEFFEREDYELITSIEDAYRVTGKKFTSDTELAAMGFEPDEIALRHLKVITEAINGSWKADWSDPDQKKWVPWFDTTADTPSGFAFCATSYDYSRAYAGRAARLCFETGAKAAYAGKTFTELYRISITYNS